MSAVAHCIWTASLWLVLLLCDLRWNLLNAICSPLRRRRRHQRRLRNTRPEDICSSGISGCACSRRGWLMCMPVTIANASSERDPRLNDKSMVLLQEMKAVKDAVKKLGKKRKV